MKIAPLMKNDRWYKRVLSDDNVRSDSLVGVPMECTVEMELVELLHGGAEENYRPYLHMRGELTEVRPSVELPYGVNALTMRRGMGMLIDAFYDFSPNQLTELVGKGYFTSAFRVPEEMTGSVWDLPGLADFLVVAPELSDQPPLVFLNVHHQTGMEFDESSSGYELVTYFPDYSAEAEAEAASVEAEVEAPQYSEGVLDVFRDIALPEHDVVADAPAPDLAESRALVPDGVFARLVSELRPLQPQSMAAAEPEPEVREPSAVSAQDLYATQIVPGVERALSAEVFDDIVADDTPSEREQVPVAGEGVVTDVFVDVLGEAEPAPDLTPLLSQAVEDEHLKVSRRRTSALIASLDAQDDETERSDAEHDDSGLGS